MHPSPLIWTLFVALIGALLVVDLVGHRSGRAVSIREAAAWSGVWMALGLAFGGVLWALEDGTVAGEYLGGFLLEKSLAVDNVFVFALLFTYFAVPTALQHRVLLYGIVLALVFRAGFIAAGSAMLDAFHLTIYVFGAFLVYTGVRIARHAEIHVDPERNPLLRGLRRLVPVSDEYVGSRFLVRREGRLVATPMLAVLLAVAGADVLFAVDSIPAIFAVTDDAFVVFAANAFAILGLRALYFLLAGMLGRFAYLNAGLAAVLVLIGAKMLLTDVWQPPLWASLTAIVAILGGAVVASLLRPAPTAPDPEAAPREPAGVR